MACLLRHASRRRCGCAVLRACRRGRAVFKTRHQAHRAAGQAVIEWVCTQVEAFIELRACFVIGCVPVRAWFCAWGRVIGCA